MAKTMITVSAIRTAPAIRGPHTRVGVRKMVGVPAGQEGS